jgi:WD40 repeat protein
MRDEHEQLALIINDSAGLVIFSRHRAAIAMAPRTIIDAGPGLHVDALQITPEYVACVASKFTGRLWQGYVRARAVGGDPSSDGVVGPSASSSEATPAKTTAGIATLAAVGNSDFVTGNDAGVIEQWRVVDGAVARVDAARAHDGAITAVAHVAPSSLVTGGVDGRLRWCELTALDVATATVQRAHVSAVLAIAVNPSDPSLVATSGEDGVVKVWKVKAAAGDGDGTARDSCQLSAARAGADVRDDMGKAHALAWCGDDVLAVGYERGEIVLFETTALDALRTRAVVEAHGDAVRGLAWDDVGKRLASCGDDGVVAIHAGEVPRSTREAKRHDGAYVRCVAWGRVEGGGDGEDEVVSGGWDGEVKAG